MLFLNLLFLSTSVCELLNLVTFHSAVVGQTGVEYFVCCRCQDVFLDGVDLGPNIARNQALKENVFMMVICIELRIPLFLVGKPGSSKSLAKTIVADAMQGEAARTEIFQFLKSVCKHVTSFIYICLD